MAVSHRQIWRRDLTKITGTLQSNLGRRHAWGVASRRGGPLQTSKASSRPIKDRCCLQCGPRLKSFQVCDAAAGWAGTFFFNRMNFGNQDLNLGKAVYTPWESRECYKMFPANTIVFIAHSIMSGGGLIPTTWKRAVRMQAGSRVYGKR